MSKSMFFCFSLIACGLSGYGAYAGTYMKGNTCGSGERLARYARNLPYIRIYEERNDCSDDADTGRDCCSDDADTGDDTDTGYRRPV